MERFAEVRAEIERTGDRDRALREAGLSPREWVRVQRHWLAAMAGEVAQGRKELAERYCRAFEGAGSSAGSGAQAEVASPAAEPRAPDAPLIVPSYMVGRGGSGGLGGMLPLSAMAAPMAAPSPGQVPAMPAPGATPAAAAQAPAVMVPGVANVQAAPSALVGTAMALPVPRGPTMPFRPGESAVARSSAPGGAASSSASGGADSDKPGGGAGSGARMPAVNMPPPSVSGTALDLGIAKVAAAMPFKKADEGASAPSSGAASSGAASPGVPAVAAPAGPGSASPAALGAGSPAAPASPAQASAVGKLPVAPAPAVDGTALDLGIASIVAAIPFKKPEASSQATPSSSGQGAAGQRSAPSAQATPAAQAAPQSSSAQAQAPAAAPAGQAAAQVPEISVEQYAWLVAALRRARGPQDIEHAFRALRLSSDVHRPLEEHWRARMSADPALQKRFLAALQQNLPGGAR
ncbi:MAG: hypothetical protein R3B70_06780 [Polyangiaceae bacterium]